MPLEKGLKRKWRWGELSFVGVFQCAFQRLQSFREAIELLPGQAAEGMFFDGFQLAVGAFGENFSGSGQANDEFTAVARICAARDQAALVEPVQKAGERGAFVRESVMDLRNGAVAEARQMGQDVRFGLVQAETGNSRQVHADAVCRAVNFGDELQ